MKIYFYELDGDANPFKECDDTELKFLPRMGERVYFGGMLYKVTEIEHDYDHNCIEITVDGD